MRCTPMKCTPVRCTPMKCTPVRCTPMKVFARTERVRTSPHICPSSSLVFSVVTYGLSHMGDVRSHIGDVLSYIGTCCHIWVRAVTCYVLSHMGFSHRYSVLKTTI